MDGSSKAVRAGGRGGPHGGGSRFRQSGTTSEDEDEQADTISNEQRACPECGGHVHWEQREAVCSGCGLVVDNDMIDRGPEWRSFNEQQRQERRRVGSPTTDTMHDSGLSTSLGHSSEADSPQLKRMRSLNNQCDTNSKRSRRHSFAQIKRIVGSLELPTFVHERACQLFAEAQKEYALTTGRPLEGLYGAAVYAACREHELPYVLDEIAAETSISTQSVRQTYLRVNSEMGLAIRPPSPSDFIPRLVSDVNCDPDVEAHLSDFIQYRATELVKFAEEEAVVQGRNPMGVASGALYYVAQRNGCKITQHTVAGEWISVHALRQSRTALTDALDEAGESVESICAASKDNTDDSEGDSDDATETIQSAADELNEVNVVAIIDDVDSVDEDSPAVGGGQTTRQTQTTAPSSPSVTVDRAPESRIDGSGGDEPSAVPTNRCPSVTTGGVWSIPPPHSERVRYRTATAVRI